MMTKDHVCPFGIKAKDLLTRRGFDVDDHHLTSRTEIDAFKAEHDVKTTTQVFVDDKRIGGYAVLRQHLSLRTHTAGTTGYQPVVALFIGLVGALSVIKAVYIDRRELKCACVGGSSNVPLGFVSLTKNLMMILMGTWMLIS